MRMNSVLLCLALVPDLVFAHSIHWKIAYEKELKRVLDFVLRLMMGAISLAEVRFASI